MRAGALAWGMRVAMVVFGGAIACATLTRGPIAEYGVNLRETGGMQPVTAAWPPPGPAVDTTRADEQDCWQNDNDVRPGHRAQGGCAPTPTASGRFVQAARPTSCPGSMQPAIVGFTPERVSIWTCLPGCGPDDEYVTRWAQELIGGPVHVLLHAVCTTACPPGTHRGAYATPFGDSVFPELVQPGECITGDPEPALATALADEQVRQRAARDASVAAAFAEVEALIAKTGNARACASPDSNRLDQLFGALRQIRDKDVARRVADARARWERLERTLPAVAAPPAPPPPRPDTCTPACYVDQQQCLDRCGAMGPDACGTCASVADACRRGCR